MQRTFWFSLASFLTSVLHPGGSAPPGPDPTRGRAGLPLLQVGVAAGLTTLPQLSGGVPKGYLRLLVFNADSALVGQQVQPLSSAALGNYERLRLRVLVPQDGYVTAFVGNESDVDVYFDDVTVELRQGLQVQETQYDPTGLELAGLTGTTPGLKTLSQYKFNGKEFQPDLGLNWNHQDWRFFDTQLARWHVTDPEIENGQESWTPYSFGFDNAVRFADADGRKPGGGGGPPLLQMDPSPAINELTLLLEETGPALQNFATAIGLTAAAVWVGNHLPSLEQVGDALSHTSPGAAAFPGQYSPYMQTYTDSKMRAATAQAKAKEPEPASTRREQNPNDKTMPSERAARREAFRQNKVPTSNANNFKREKDPDKNPNLRGPKGEPAEKIKTQDGNGKPVVIDNHKNGHTFKDNNTYEQPHYHGPEGKGHISY